MKVTIKYVAVGMAVSLVLGMTSAQAASITNNFFGSVSTNQITMAPGAGNSQVDIWNPGSSFSVTTGIVVYASSGTEASLLMNGSTGTVKGVGTTQAIDLEQLGTGTVSLVNSLLTITNNGGGYVRIDSARRGILSLSNSTLQVRGTGGGGLYIDYNGGQQARNTGSTNLLLMKSSTIDLGAQQLTIGQAGYAAIADIQDSIITNVSSIFVGSDYNAATIANIRNSTITTTNPTSAIYFSVGSPYNASLTLDHSTLTTANYGTLFLIANGASSTGVVNLVNGSKIDFLGSTVGGRPFQIGVSGNGKLNISNSTVMLQVPAALINHQLDMEIGVNATAVGAVNQYGGTNLTERSVIVGKSGTGSYSVDGDGLVQVSVPFAQPSPAPGHVILGQSVGSTGTFTMAGSSRVIVTNSTHVSSVVVGAGGKGTFVMNGGTLTADNLFVTNGASSIFTFNAGTLISRATTVSNGSAFVVGNGTDSATLDLITGGHRFADGLTIANNGKLMGFASISNSVVVNDGGILAPGNSPGTLTIVGNLTLNSAAILNFELGPHNATGIGYIGGGTNDLVVVNGNLTLDGLLDVTALAGLGPFPLGAETNVFRLFNYTGSLVNSGLTIQTLPGGTKAWLDTSVAGQVNLYMIPEPSVMALMAAGVLFLVRKRKSHEAA